MKPNTEEVPEQQPISTDIATLNRSLRESWCSEKRLAAERDVARKLLKEYLYRFPAFRSKPVGALFSKERGEQESHIALEDLARKVFT